MPTADDFAARLKAVKADKERLRAEEAERLRRRVEMATALQKATLRRMVDMRQSLVEPLLNQVGQELGWPDRAQVAEATDTSLTVLLPDRRRAASAPAGLNVRFDHSQQDVMVTVSKHPKPGPPEQSHSFRLEDFTEANVQAWLADALVAFFEALA